MAVPGNPAVSAPATGKPGSVEEPFSAGVTQPLPDPTPQRLAPRSPAAPSRLQPRHEAFRSSRTRHAWPTRVCTVMLLWSVSPPGALGGDNWEVITPCDRSSAQGRTGSSQCPGRGYDRNGWPCGFPEALRPGK